MVPATKEAEAGGSNLGYRVQNQPVHLGGTLLRLGASWSQGKDLGAQLSVA